MGFKTVFITQFYISHQLLHVREFTSDLRVN